MLRSLPARTPLWSLENDGVCLKNQQFLCERMDRPAEDIQHALEKGFHFSPFQIIDFFFLKARKAMLRQGEGQTRRVEV